MSVDAKHIISITEVEQDFTRATRVANEIGHAVILENNRPKYKLINLEIEQDLELTDDEKIDIVSRRVMERYKPAFMELAKR